MNMNLKGIDIRKAHAIEIFQEGIKAVAPGVAIQKYCRRQGNNLTIGSDIYNLSEYKNIFVVGAGKAGAAMAATPATLVSMILSDVVGDDLDVSCFDLSPLG